MLKINESVGLDPEYSDVMYFNTDDDFYTFCVEPILVPIEYTNANGEIAHYVDFNFTNQYQDAINKNIAFVIKDKNSQIMKHDGVVSYRTISKQAQNLEPWYYKKTV